MLLTIVNKDSQRMSRNGLNPPYWYAVVWFQKMSIPRPLIEGSLVCIDPPLQKSQFSSIFFLKALAFASTLPLKISLTFCWEGMEIFGTATYLKSLVCLGNKLINWRASSNNF